MAIKNIGKGIKDSLSSTANAVKEKVKEVEMPDLKKVGEQAADQVKNLFQKKDDKEADVENTSVKEVEETDAPRIEGISTKNAIKTIYFLMASDGEIQPDEMKDFDTMGTELDPKFPTFKDQLIKECQKSIDKAIEPKDYYDTIQDGIEDALLLSKRTEDTYISPKLLIWDLLTIAYSNKEYTETERRVMKYIVRKLDIDKTVFLEMENSMLTIIDLQKELTWIKTTDRPYLTIEAMVNEISARQVAIFDSIKDLISL